MNAGNYFQGQKRLEVFNQLIFIPAYLEHHCVVNHEFKKSMIQV